MFAHAPVALLPAHYARTRNAVSEYA